MKKIILSLLVVIIYQVGHAQSGRITYTITHNLAIDSLDDLSASLGDMLPEELSTKKELLFDKQISLYRSSEDASAKQGEDSDDMMLFSFGDEEDGILYVDHANKKKVHQTSILGRPFTIQDDIKRLSWKITNEKIKYLGYECTKAIHEDSLGKVIAWFAPKLPMGMGPDGYFGLPGSILMLSIDDGMSEIKATEITMEDVSSEIKAPSKGKIVSQAEYDRIYDKKMNEIMQYSDESEGNIKVIDMRN